MIIWDNIIQFYVFIFVGNFFTYTELISESSYDERSKWIDLYGDSPICSTLFKWVLYFVFDVAFLVANKIVIYSLHIDDEYWGIITRCRIDKCTQSLHKNPLQQASDPLKDIISHLNIDTKLCFNHNFFVNIIVDTLTISSNSHCIFCVFYST